MTDRLNKVATKNEIDKFVIFKDFWKLYYARNPKTSFFKTNLIKVDAFFAF